MSAAILTGLDLVIQLIDRVSAAAALVKQAHWKAARSPRRSLRAFARCWISISMRSMQKSHGP